MIRITPAGNLEEPMTTEAQAYTAGWKACMNGVDGSEIPAMRPRTGRRGSDRQLVKLLAAALDNLSRTPCTFWACNGPSKPRHMCTCIKCWSMRDIATVATSLQARIKVGEG
jgi:hypothetical protein